VASGVLGANSFRGGFKAAALGLVLHFVIAFVAAAVFYVASLKLRFLINQAVIAGVLYGALVYLVMTFVVVPLSAAPFEIRFQLVTGLLVHIVCIGLPIALIIRRFRAS
jgi:hypothetical protein